MILAKTLLWPMRPLFVLAGRDETPVRLRKYPFLPGASALLALAVVACGPTAGADPAPAVATTAGAEVPLPSSTAPPSTSVGPQLTEQESKARAEYLENASRAIDLIGKTAQLLGSTGIDASRAGDELAGTKSLAAAALGSFDLVNLGLGSVPVPEGLEELNNAILTTLELVTIP